MKIVLSGLMLLAHSWYPWACCHDQHCHPVPCETIKAHGLGLSWNGVVFTQEMIKDLPDEQCHVCVDTVGKYRYPDWMKEAEFFEILRVIREEESPRPSRGCRRPRSCRASRRAGTSSHGS